MERRVMLRPYLLVILACCAQQYVFCNSEHRETHPNIIFILTDDQDVVLGGQIPMEKTRKLVGDAGVTFTNMFVTSPLCCPSRSSILTGKYVHNGNALNNSIAGNCSSPQWQATAEKHAFITHIKQQKYNTFFAGKYLNQYGKGKAGGVQHVPPGWDTWIGLVGNSKYYDYTLSVNGTAEKHGHKYPDDYLTEIIGKRAEVFLNEQTTGAPFFMMLATPACHAPFTPAPKYAKQFPNNTAPRNGSFNKHGLDKHWLIRQAKSPMSKTSIQYSDDSFRNRWRTLLTVDDIVENLVNTLEKKKLLNNTYIVFSSDNGFHLGQFSLPVDKRQLYEFDVRVPLMVRGPGIKAKQVRKEPVLNIDLAPTFIDIAGGAPPSEMDGQSFKPLLMSAKAVADWRGDFMVEHSGEYSDSVLGCPQYLHQKVYNCNPDCVCEDSFNNSYQCVRTIKPSMNLMYCEFADHENFVEVYDLAKDPDQLHNIAKTVDPKILVKQNQRLVELSVCKGPSCRGVRPFPPPPPIPMYPRYPHKQMFQKYPKSVREDKVLRWKKIAENKVYKFDQINSRKRDWYGKKML